MFSEQELQDLRERAREDIERCRALRAEQERVVRENNMTVVDLLEMLEPEDGNYDHKTVEEVLSLILRRAEYYYDDGEDDLCGFAIGLAHLAVRANGINKGTAKEMTRYMAMLANFMLAGSSQQYSWRPPVMAQRSRMYGDWCAVTASVSTLARTNLAKSAGGLSLASAP